MPAGDDLTALLLVAMTGCVDSSDTGQRGADWIPVTGVTDERSPSRAIVVIAVRMLQGRMTIEPAGSVGTRVHVDFSVKTST